MGKTSPAGERTNNSDSFTVQDGLLHIQASGKTSAHLFYVGDLKEGFEKFNNFELEAIRVFHGGDNGAYRYSLFNLRDDLSEKHNLAAAQPERVKELDALIEHFLTDRPLAASRSLIWRNPSMKSLPARLQKGQAKQNRESARRHLVSHHPNSSVSGRPSTT